MKKHIPISKMNGATMRTFLLCSILSLLLSTGLFGQIPQIISYQGVLTDAGGSVVADGLYTMSFRLYASETGTTVLWLESQMVPVINGLFNALLGKDPPLDLPFSQTYWLGVTVGERSELWPRTQLTSSAYSLRARAVADGAVITASMADGAVTGSKIAGSAVIAGSNISVGRDEDDNLVISAEVPDGRLFEVTSDTTLTGKGTASEPLGLAIHAASTDYIVDRAVTTDKLEDGAVTQEKLDLSISLFPGGPAGGDLSGNFPTPTVSGIQGREVIDAAPDIGQVLKWDGTSWEPAVDAHTTYTAGAGLTLSDTQFSVHFAGSGGATTVSRSDHNHFGQSWTGSGTGLELYGGNIGLLAEGSERGVFAQTDSDDGIAIYGYADASQGAGVYGINASPRGVVYGVYGETYSTAGYGVYGRAASSTANYGVYSFGNTGATGVKSALVETRDYGWRQLYAVESPRVLFEDVGSAQLVNGRAVVRIDPTFAQTVNLNEPYQVFVTPLGDCGLYVSEKTAASFAVNALDGRTCSLDFDYRIIATRLGYEETRLAPATDPASLPAFSEVQR